MKYTVFDTPVVNSVMHTLSLVLMKVCGWRKEGEIPDLPKFVMIAAPHTSNWDLPITLALTFAYRVKLYWMGKEAIFRPPFKQVMQWLGGIPIDRSKSNDVVGQSIAAFKENERLILLVPPEGTRAHVTHWRTGFYYIALGAGVPIILGYVDYKRKVGGFGPVLMPSGDIEADMRKIRSFYMTVSAKYPAKSSLANLATGRLCVAGAY